ncbi:hypothetical protein NA56DRAFT_703503 [Hyaloscypha hepaticicola]|uniref:Uncharacterized protein n=1 Tax=Hyaloscypha hepaticicola TaxID=2082293 RepID=A0A2J6Q4V4_9HELO|nr:hypothetical protein NA56DRAFT_703503 [Hyaloscypha hepaticicola]
MSASTPKKTGTWSEAEDRSILLQALYLGSTMGGMKHENIRLAAKEFSNVQSGSVSSMTSAPAVTPSRFPNAGPQSDYQRSANPSPNTMREGFSMSPCLPVTASKFPNDTRSSSSAYGTGQANRSKSFQAAAEPIAPSKVTKKKNNSRTSKKKKLNLDPFSTSSDESEEFSVYGESEDADVDE